MELVGFFQQSSNVPSGDTDTLRKAQYKCGAYRASASVDEFVCDHQSRRAMRDGIILTSLSLLVVCATSTLSKGKFGWTGTPLTP